MKQAADGPTGTTTTDMVRSGTKTGGSAKRPVRSLGGTESGPKLRIGAELLDTTWRIAVPVVLFACLGIAADRTLGSKPWVTLLGMVLGFVLAAVLVRRQLRRWPVGKQNGPYKNYYREEDEEDEEEKDYYND